MAAAKKKLEADLEKMAGRVCRHMNADHPESVLAYARFYAGLRQAVRAEMVGADATAFVLDVAMPDGSARRGVRIAYDAPLAAAGEIRGVAVRMHKAAFHGLGVRYKLAHGYYSGAVRQVWAHAPRPARWAAAAAAVAVVVFAARS